MHSPGNAEMIHAPVLSSQIDDLYYRLDDLLSDQPSAKNALLTVESVARDLLSTGIPPVSVGSLQSALSDTDKCMRCLYTVLFDPPVPELELPASLGRLLARILILELRLCESLLRGVSTAIIAGNATLARELFSSCAAKLSEVFLILAENQEQILSFLTGEEGSTEPLSRPLSEANLLRKMIHL